jgi:hypothetical protein
MIIAGREIAGRIIGMVVGVIVLIVAVGLFVKSCDNRRNQAAQTRMDREMGDAASNISADAIGTVARSGEAAAASEELTRENEKEIRNAQGADERVGAGVNAAGLRSLCKRDAYRDSERCRVFKRNP